VPLDKVWAGLPETHQQMIEQAVTTLSANARGRGWSYCGPSVRQQVKGYDPENAGWSDNSNAHFAVLGLRAAALLGAPVKSRLLHNEAVRLVDDYVPDRRMDKIRIATCGRSEPQGRKDQIQPGGWRYSPVRGFNTRPPSVAMTADGMASLLLIKEQLGVDGQLGGDLGRAVDLALGGARAWLDRNMAYPTSVRRWARDTDEGIGLFYDQLALAQASRLAGLEMIGDCTWREEVTGLLLEAQAPDGSWPDLLPARGMRMVDVCFAILVLAGAPVPVPVEPVPVTTDD
jgi:hypothetical protein